MRIGVLTGGGDCPGLNAVIRAVVTKGVNVHGHDFVGFRDGWRGVLEGDTVAVRLGQEKFVDRLAPYVELASALSERVADIDYVDARYIPSLVVGSRRR